LFYILPLLFIPEQLIKNPTQKRNGYKSISYKDQFHSWLILFARIVKNTENIVFTFAIVILLMIIPSYLKKGDTIGIVCPSGYMPFDKIETCISTLKTWGYKVAVGNTVGNQFNYFSGTDEERLNDLQSMLDDTNIKAILCGRGGYGLSRIIDKINFAKFKKNPKWMIGYSDITLLHSHINKQLKIASIHSPMAAAFNDGGFENQFVLSLQKTLKGNKAKYTCNPHSYNKTGVAEGELAGGNLCMIAHTLGTPSAYNTKNKILFLEDIGEYIYNIDRMFLQLKRAGVLKGLAGLIIGGFTDLKDTTIPFGMDVYAIIKEHIDEYDFPVAFDFPVGHQTENYALKIGVAYSLNVNKKTVSLKEQ
jgi:muramoyltetrapeptide carboxypeptidase